MTIGITDTMISEDKFNHYVKWLEGSGFDISWNKLSYKLNNLDSLKFCDGIILTGGGDISPELYNVSINHPKISGIDRKRDDFERKVIDRTFKNNIPLLAICRGMQLVNVHLGGSLIPDIEEAGFKSHKNAEDGENVHDIILQNNSNFFNTAGSKKGTVNSSHHQAVDRLGNGLIDVGRSGDGIIEAIELTDSQRKSFMLLLQWHPERMTDTENPFKAKILQKFLTESLNQHTKKG